MAIDDNVHRLTSAEYERMVELGALEDMRVEFLDGQLVDMSPQSEEHVRGVQALHELALGIPDVSRVMRLQMTLPLAEGWAPEPDFALAPMRPRGEGHPRTALLVAEVSVSTRITDRRKAGVYAAAGIPRYWLVDVPAACVWEHTEPTPDGYGLVHRLVDADVLDAGIDGMGATTVAALLAW